ncbi:MAG: penicillin-binding protein activator [Bdellovibrionaceae bacterium]|nr:penicillin-binding protein activator [Pseudobdellovibrionaceae bacterium]
MKILSIFIFLGLLTSCVTAPEFQVKKVTPTQKSKGPNAQEAIQLKKAQDAIANSDPKTALLILDDIAKSRSETETYFDALILMGRLLEREGRQEEATKAYLRIINSNYDYPKRSFAIFRVAQIYKARGNAGLAIQYIDLGLQQPNLAIKDRVIFQRLKYPLLIQQEQYAQALETADFVIKNATKESEIAEARDVTQNLISIRLNRQQLAKIVNDPSMADYHGLAYVELGKSYFYEGNITQAYQLFDKALTLLKPNDPARLQIQDLKRYSAVYTDIKRNTIAVLVPLTGSRKAIGENVLRGLQTSVGGMGSDIKLIIKDTEASSTKAQALAQQAIFEDRVMGVIGGVTAADAEAIVEVTSKFGVPFLALTPKAGLVENHDYTFQNAFTLKTAARKSAEMVLKEGKYHRIAVLKSADNFGETYAEAFIQVLTDNGKEVQHVESYDLNDRGSLNQAIRKLIQVYSAEGREAEYKQKLEAWKAQNPRARRLNPPSVDELLPPVIDFDALFIADSAKNGALVAATLAYFDVEEIPLIGTHLWNSPELVRRAPQQVEGSVFIDSLPPENSWPANSCTRSLSQALNGREPNAFTVLGYDSARIFRTALRRGSTNRVQFKESLETLPSIEGCLGPLSMDPSRVVNRPVFSLKVQGGSIINTDTF